MFQIKILEKYNIKRIEHLGVQFNYYYTPQYQLNPIVPDTFIPDIFHKILSQFNIYSETGNIFSGYVFNFWNDTHKSVPDNVKTQLYFINNKSKIVDINLSKFKTKNWDQESKILISNIVARLYAYFIKFNKKSFIKTYWYNLRGYICKNKSIQLDLFIEDFKIFFGISINVYSVDIISDNNIFMERFDNARNIKGLKDLILMWKYFFDLIQQNSMYSFVISKQFISNAKDINYIGLLFFKKKYVDFFKSFEICKVDRIGFYVFDTLISEWILKKSFLT